MFDSVTGTRNTERSAVARGVSGTVTILLHVAIIVALLTVVYAVDQPIAEPEVPSVIAFTAPEPVVPDPPSAPPPPASPPKTVKAPITTTTSTIPEREDIPLVAAPVEAPPTIGPETGLEGYLGQRRSPVTDGEGGVSTSSGIPGGTGLPGAGLPPPPKVVRIGGNVAAPKLVHKVDPEYPEVAQRAHVGGVVVLEATVDVKGRVTGVRALRAHPFLQQAAINAVREWQYEPLMLNGVPTPFVLTVTITFTAK